MESTKMNFEIRLTTQLWGTDYIEAFLSYVIPTLHSTKNLKTLQSINSIIYEFHSTPDGLDCIEKSESLVRLKWLVGEALRFEFSPIDTEIEDSYAMMSNCHRQSISKSEQNNEVLFFVQPDVLMSDGIFDICIDQLKHGKRTALIPGFRTAKEKILPQLEKNEGSLTTRELAELAYDCQHRISRSLFWDQDEVHSYCSHLYWKIPGKKAIYMKCAHMHPFMVFPVVKGCGFDHTIDWDYFSKACPDPKTWYIAGTSDALSLIEFSEEKKFADHMTMATPDHFTLNRFFGYGVIDAHMHLIKHEYILTAENVEPPDYRAIQIYARKLIIKAKSLPVLYKLKSYLKAFTKTFTSIVYFMAFLIEMRNIFANYRNRLLARKKKNIVSRIEFILINTVYVLLRFFYRIFLKASAKTFISIGHLKAFPIEVRNIIAKYRNRLLARKRKNIVSRIEFIMFNTAYVVLRFFYRKFRQLI